MAETTPDTAGTGASSRSLAPIREAVGYHAGHECVLAIVGSTSLIGNKRAIQGIKEAFDRHDPRWVVSGGAVGIDTMAVEEAERLSCQVTIYRPTEHRWGGEHGYKARNKQIADACEHLVRIWDCQTTTYGSGWTAKEARRQGKPVDELMIHTEGCRHPQWHFPALDGSDTSAYDSLGEDS